MSKKTTPHYNIITKRLKAGDAISLKKEEKEEKETEE